MSAGQQAQEVLELCLRAAGRGTNDGAIKVQELDELSLNSTVARLQVAMHDALRMHLADDGAHARSLIQRDGPVNA